MAAFGSPFFLYICGMKSFITVLLLLVLVACTRETPYTGDPLGRPVTEEERSYVEPDFGSTYVFCDFEENSDPGLDFSSSMLENRVVDNPRKLGANKTDKCLMVVENGEGYIKSGYWCQGFARNGKFAKIFVKVLSPRKGVPILLSLLQPDAITHEPTVVQGRYAYTTTENSWEDLEFDFTGWVGTALVKEIRFTIEGKEDTAGAVWYFDEYRRPVGTVQ